MADEFEQFLASSLAPPNRVPDRRFVAAVQARVALEDQLRRERRALVANLAKQLAGLVAIAAAVWTIGKAPPVADFFAGSPAASLGILLLAFAFVAAMLSPASRSAMPTFVTS
jgi:hypothetical protein